MSLYKEYIDKKLSVAELETELLKLITQYNHLTNAYLFVYASAFKNIPDNGIVMDDFYFICDLLKATQEKNLHFYLESPGGFAEAVEEIAEWIHDKFDHITFVISGEAKSAGTLLTLSGHQISMTDTGSLGPVEFV